MHSSSPIAREALRGFTVIESAHSIAHVGIESGHETVTRSVSFAAPITREFVRTIR
jgi:hypothetical protein